MKRDYIIGKEKKAFVKANEMKMGEIGIIRKSASGDTYHAGTLVMRTYGTKIVALAGQKVSCGDTWGIDCSFDIELLPEGTEIKIVV